MLAHPSFGAWWSTFDVAARHAQFVVPAYHLTGWYDALLNGTLRNFAGLRARAGTATARRNQRLIVGPWTHARPTASATRIGKVDYGVAAGFDAESLIIAWFRQQGPGYQTRMNAVLRAYMRSADTAQAKDKAKE